MEKLISENIQNRMYEIYENLRQSEKFDEYYSNHLEDYPYLTESEDMEYVEETATKSAEADIAEEAIEQILEEIKDELNAAWFNI